MHSLLCFWMLLVEVDLKKVPHPLGQCHLSCGSSSSLRLLLFCRLRPLKSPPRPAALLAAARLSNSGRLGQLS